MLALHRSEIVPGFSTLQLEGENIFLRPPRTSDWSNWVQVRERNLAHLKPFEPRWTQDCLSKAYFKRRVSLQSLAWRNDNRYCFLIVSNDSEKLIGGININNVCRGSAHFATLGYWIDKDYEGIGYMSESVRLAIAFGFTSRGLHRVNASCILKNDRSKKLLMRLGFKKEGMAEKYLCIDGKWQDHYLFGLNIEDWA